MERDESALVLMGQDIGAFEGAFRTTRGLHARWPDRVLDTPIAESGTIGIAIGAAVLGYRAGGRDAVRRLHLLRLQPARQRGGQALLPLAGPLPHRRPPAVGRRSRRRPLPLAERRGLVRADGGHQGRLPGHRGRRQGRCCRPPSATPTRSCFFEHKFLYRRIKEVLPDGRRPWPASARRESLRPGTHLTLIGYGATTWTCLEAAEDLAAAGVEAEVIDLRTLVPYDEETVTRLGEEDRPSPDRPRSAAQTLGFGAEVAARLADAAFPWLDAPIRRVTYPDRPVPYARVLENELLPTREKVLAAARELLAY